MDLNGNGDYDNGETFTDQGNGKYDPGDSYTDTNQNGQFDPGDYWIDLNGDGVWDLGEPRFDLYVNGRYDVGEPFLDENGNGVWDLRSEPFVDANENGEVDPGSYRPQVFRGGWQRRVRQRCGWPGDHPRDEPDLGPCRRGRAAVGGEPRRELGERQSGLSPRGRQKGAPRACLGAGLELRARWPRCYLGLLPFCRRGPQSPG